MLTVIHYCTPYKNKKPCKSKTYRAISVPLKDEILNLWNGFLAIIDFIQANPDITKIIASL